jgi:hypothetical protein
MKSFITCTLSKYNQNYQVKEHEMGRACIVTGEKRNTYRILVGKPEGKRPLGRLRCMWGTTLKWILER